jgi:hypothetical protein
MMELHRLVAQLVTERVVSRTGAARGLRLFGAEHAQMVDNKHHLHAIIDGLLLLLDRGDLGPEDTCVGPGAGQVSLHWRPTMRALRAHHLGPPSPNEVRRALRVAAHLPETGLVAYQGRVTFKPGARRRALVLDVAKARAFNNRRLDH